MKKFYLWGSIAFAITLNALAQFLLSSDYVHITFHNHSSHSIDFIKISKEGKIYTLRDLKRKTIRKFKLPVHGESSYLLEVTFNDGKRLEGGPGYVESDYKVEEIIRDHEIISDINLPTMEHLFLRFLFTLSRIFFIPLMSILFLHYVFKFRGRFK